MSSDSTQRTFRGPHAPIVPPRRLLVIALACWFVSAAVLGGEPKSSGKGDADSERASAYAAHRLFKKGEELLENKEYDRAINLLETLIEQYPQSPKCLQAHLILGKHYIGKEEHPKGLAHLRPLTALKKPDTKLDGDELEIYLEAMYQSGFSHFKTGQYPLAFPFFRAITNEYQNTIWGNQSYYYIGMCHFHQSNWNNAVQALGLVGTFVDPKSPVARFVEAGRRFHVKIDDADLPVLTRQGMKITANLKTRGGDEETITFRRLTGKGDVMIASISSDLGVPRPKDNLLQVVGGDVITLTYVDDNDDEGKKRVPRVYKVDVVSTASLAFTQGTFEAIAEAAYLSQPLYVKLIDADLDLTTNKDQARVKLIARYKAPEEEEGAEPKEEKKGLAIWEGEEEEEVKYITRDEVTVTLEEQGNAPVRTGRFGGSVQVVMATEGQAPDQKDGLLAALVGDEIVATYLDERHAAGDEPRTATTRIKVLGELDNTPRATQYVVSDPVDRAKKSLHEAEAYLELGRIFRSMGLYEGAGKKCDQGLRLVDPVISTDAALPRKLKESAFKLRWELYMVKNDYARAIQTCSLFSKLFPDSPFADEALMGIGKIKLKEGSPDESIRIFTQVLNLKNSQAKAEAQFLMAKAAAKQAKMKSRDGKDDGMKAAIPHFKRCAERYPRSPFAGEALANLVDYYADAKDYTQANELLEQIFQDYPDADFLDSMLLKWVIVSYRMGDYRKAHAKCQKLLFDWPSSKFAPKAKKILPKLVAKLKASGG